MYKNILFLIFSCYCLHAEVQTFVEEYSFRAGDSDSKLTAKAFATEQCKRTLQEKVGIYLESRSTITNYILTQDEIRTLSVGILQFKILEDKWNGQDYWLKAEIKVDPEDVLKQIILLREDDKKVVELRRLKTENDSLFKIQRMMLQQFSMSQSSTPVIKKGNPTVWVVLGTLVTVTVVTVIKLNIHDTHTTEVSFQ